MIWTYFGAHLVGMVLAALAGRTSMRRGLAVAALAPAATAAWSTALLLDDQAPRVAEAVWVEGLDLSIRFRLDSLALMMTLLVSGIGALVFVYAIGYFSREATGGVRFPTSLLAFSTSMLGLVWADSIWTLFIFWEATSVTSFLLVGHQHVDASVRDAARRALIITGGGGLVLLAGLIVLANEAGSTTLTDLDPVSGSAASLAAVLIMVGAATKSAQVPFHVWLPGAMAAPTPVSAYLHSATMVKAGILLIAVASPAFVEVGAWKAVGLTFGIASMIWGAVGALRHRDAKLILAWGTVSQLGLLATLFSLGSAKATFAGVAILFAHALFKAALFLVVGEIDIRTGTRDINDLGGLYRSMPIAFGVALVAALSMAGAPPLLGFMAKEAAIEAVLGLTGPERVIAMTAVVGGSVLTVAYTSRFMISVFGRGPDTPVAPARPAMTVPGVILGSAGVIGFFVVGPVNRLIIDAATEVNRGAAEYELIQWPGLKTAFVISMAILASGVVLGLALSRTTRAVPVPLGANAADGIIAGILDRAPRITALVQHGSLPVYLATMGLTISVAGLPFLTALSTDHLVWYDEPIQVFLAAAVVGSALAGAFVGSRLGAALSLGAVGLGATGLFVVHGAPDLALTQLLVETIIVVGFVLGLGHLGRKFPRPTGSWKTIRLAVAGFGGVAVTGALVASASSPTGNAPVGEIAEGAITEGGGNNIVNVILTDLRSLDTLGEVVVLATVAVGILALARVRHQELAT